MRLDFEVDGKNRRYEAYMLGEYKSLSDKYMRMLNIIRSTVFKTDNRRKLSKILISYPHNFKDEALEFVIGELQSPEFGNVKEVDFNKRWLALCPFKVVLNKSAVKRLKARFKELADKVNSINEASEIAVEVWHNGECALFDETFQESELSFIPKSTDDLIVMYDDGALIAVENKFEDNTEQETVIKEFKVWLRSIRGDRESMCARFAVGTTVPEYFTTDILNEILYNTRVDFLNASHVSVTHTFQSPTFPVKIEIITD